MWFSGSSSFPTYFDDNGTKVFSELVRVDAWGNALSVTRPGCNSDMDNSSTLALHQYSMHEMRFVPELSAARDPALLVSGYAVHALGAGGLKYTADGRNYSSDDLISGTVFKWRPAAAASGGAELSELLDLGDTVTPELTGLVNVGVGDMEVEVTCGGASPTFRGVDYMHQSSCAASAADGATTVLSSLRNLNAVIASDVESGEVAWVLASDPSLNTSYKTYAFAHEQEKFYYPHMVSQLPDGHVLLVDDGNNRPGCARGSESSCYSRAVEYALVDGRVRVDARSGVLVSDEGEAAAKNGTTNASATYADGVARLVWQFEAPFNFSDPRATNGHGRVNEADDLDSKIGNSVSRLEASGHYVVGFTTLTRGRDTYAEIFDVTAKGTLHAAMRVHNVSFYGDGAYRALPYETIYGETRACPLG